jgi:hypothetical protein
MNHVAKAGETVNFGPGIDIPCISPQDSAEAMKKIVDEATVASHGGKFFNYDGSPYPW